MPTDIHLTSGEIVYTDVELGDLQSKLTGDLWAVVDTQSGERAAIRTDQVAYLLGREEYKTAGF